MSRKKTIPGEADIRTLITHITGFESDDVNFDLCLQFVQSHVKYHRFLSVDSHKIIKTLNGICTKFSVHCQNDKAEALKTLTEKFELSPLSKQTTQTKTDGHYAVLSLLLELSNCPTENVFREKQVVQPEVEPEFDWAGYLLADEDYYRSHYLDSTYDSEDEEDTNDFNQGVAHLETIATESNDFTGTVETQKNWLLRNLVIQYWNNDSKEDNATGRFPCSNLHRNWDRCLIEGNPFHVSRQSFITEIQLIREILWMLSGVSKSYVFIFEERRFSVNPDVYLSHLTDYCMENSLQKFMKYGSQVMALETFCQDVVNYSCDSIDMSSVTQTYQAFVSSLSQFLKDFKKFLSGREIEVRNQETPITMSILYNQLEPWFQKIELVYSIYISGIAAAAELDSSILKASHLLNVMFKTLIDCDTLRDPDKDKMSLLLVIWIQTCRPYFDILSDWITYGNLIDPREDFLIQR
ncbi:gamma-tubulin complex component 5 [Patella vulgata]|uniref:gamma-tubulin complex component 5 n=1 Tax=Patella vulgata TaxID=6465 RepID=UPI00217F4460|nr:gamma-tubulin complex component 5 [Patella vulgata]